MRETKTYLPFVVDAVAKFSAMPMRGNALFDVTCNAFSQLAHHRFRKCVSCPN